MTSTRSEPAPIPNSLSLVEIFISTPRLPPWPSRPCTEPPRCARIFLWGPRRRVPEPGRRHPETRTHHFSSHGELLCWNEYSHPRPVLGSVSSGEELLQHRHEHLGGHDVFLAFQDPEPPVRQALRNLPAHGDHPVRARPAYEDEGLGPHAAEQVRRHDAAGADVAHDL